MSEICEKHHTPARNNPQKHTLRYYDISCPYCRIELRDNEIFSLRSELERMESILLAKDAEIEGYSINTDSVLDELAECQKERDELLRQLGAMASQQISATELALDTIRQQPVERCCELMEAWCELPNYRNNLTDRIYRAACGDFCDAIRAEFGVKG